METIKKYLISVIMNNPVKLLTFLGIVSAISLMFLPALKNDPSPWLLKESHPVRQALEKLRNDYTGSGDSIFILLETDKSIFTKKTLTRIANLTEAIESIDLIQEKDLNDLRQFSEKLKGPSRQKVLSILNGTISTESWEEFDALKESITISGQMTPDNNRFLESIRTKIEPVAKVTSITNTDNVTAIGDELIVGPIIESVPDRSEEMDELIKKVTGNRMFKDVLFTDDHRFTSIIVELAIHDSDSDNQYLIYEAIKTLLEKKITGSEKHYIAGMPVASASMGHTIETDSMRLFPIVLIMVTACLFVSFRMFMGIIVPIVVVLFSLIITLACKVWFNVPINVITSSLPVFILSIGVADGIHFFSEFRDNLLDGATKKVAVEKALTELFNPIVMTSITTATAFWALSVTNIIQLKHFGLYVALGTLIAMIFSLVFIPALLQVLPEIKTSQKDISRPGIDRYLNKILDSISITAIKNPYIILMITLIIISVSAYGASKVIVDNNNVEYQLDDSPIVISSKKINDSVAGSVVLNVLIEEKGSSNEVFKDPIILKSIDTLSEYIRSKSIVGKVTGLPELIKRINFVMHQENLDYDRLPVTVETASDGTVISGKELLSQYLLLYENSGGDILTDMVHSDYNSINLLVVVKNNSSRELGKLIDDIRIYAKQLLPETLSVEFSGSGNLMVEATREIVAGQIVSLSISFVLICIILMYTFRSIYTGLIGMFPLIITILFNFGLMGFFKIPLDIGTAVISSIVIGIGVDYSIHYLKRMKDAMERDYSFEKSIIYTVRHSGKAIFANAFTVGIGFIALTFSKMTPLITMGWMITVTMFVSALSTLVLLPAVLSLFEQRCADKAPISNFSSSETIFNEY